MEASLEDALTEALGKLERGEGVPDEWLRARHPRHWSTLRSLLAFEGHLRGEIRPGSRLGPWTVRRRIGRGGMGTAFEATNASGKRVVLKILHPHLTRQASTKARFFREAEASRRIRHPGVARVGESRVVTHGCRALHVLEMEYVEGRALADVLRTHGPMPEDRCVALGRELACALAAIHAAGVVHRDLKPSNILLGSDGARILDMGLAWMVGEVMRLSQTGEFVGSIPYAAPEQFCTTAVGPDVRTDLYALGATLFEAAVGRLPWQGQWPTVRIAVAPPNLRAYAPHVSEGFDAVVAKLLRPRPVDRYESASAVEAALLALPPPQTAARPPVAHPGAESALERAITSLIEGGGRVLAVVGTGAPSIVRGWAERIRLGQTIPLIEPEAWRRRSRDLSPERCRNAFLEWVATHSAERPYVYAESERVSERSEDVLLASAIEAARWHPVLVIRAFQAGFHDEELAGLRRLGHVRWIDVD